MSAAIHSVRKYLVLFVILAFPCALYYFLKEKGENRYKPLAIYGQKKVAATFHTKRGQKIPDTIYHQIRDFKLLNQEGDTVRFPADSNQITVVNFFFTRCPSFCPSMNTEMGRVAKIYANNRLMRFLSVSVDPEHDTSEVLKKYSAPYTSLNSKWDFLTGDKEMIYSIAREDFLVDAFKDTTSENNYIHSPMLILIDPQKRIRGYYDSTAGSEQSNLLIDEIKLLITEELRTIKIDKKNRYEQ